MKVALCLHGLFSSTTDKTSNGYDGYEHIKKHILDVVDTDVFVHSWEHDKMSDINKLYNPTLSIFEGQKDFSKLIKERGLDKLERTPRYPQSVLSHFYSIQRVFNLVYNSDIKYDVVIKARFDLGRINRRSSGRGGVNPYAVQCINFQPNIVNDKIYMADWNHFHMGPADMWFYGSMDTMTPFTTIYQSLEDNMIIDGEFHQFATNIENNRGDLSNSIAFYKWWMIQNRLWKNRINLETIWE